MCIIHQYVTQNQGRQLPEGSCCHNSSTHIRECCPCHQSLLCPEQVFSAKSIHVLDPRLYGHAAYLHDVGLQPSVLGGQALVCVAHILQLNLTHTSLQGVQQG
jgi:hypothetical protein